MYITVVNILLLGLTEVECKFLSKSLKFLVTKVALPWRSLHSLYNGILGKSLLVVSLATPVSLLYSSIHFIPSNYPTILIGALLSLSGFIYTEISTPPLIKDFKDSHQYSSEILKVAGNVDWISEFKVLEENITSLSDEIDGYYSVPLNFISIDFSKKILGEERAIRSLSMLKFNYCNKTNSYKRLALTITLYLSLVIIFSSTATHIYNILLG